MRSDQSLNQSKSPTGLSDADHSAHSPNWPALDAENYP
ncbi:hypothetical protein NT01EI_1520 [Edwardsiella ictaluri 93-146]|uniref:Uncharacterized protein n=1 Tax=Edwardsiella ictaluri (strain 93-146) TaxID=634503 RepID=C5B7X0_EDWI9|nr:hypothetical protein NT01EI_1520 [Edwardsiella ictaluri 93-146]